MDAQACHRREQAHRNIQSFFREKKIWKKDTAHTGKPRSKAAHFCSGFRRSLRFHKTGRYRDERNSPSEAKSERDLDKQIVICT